MSKFSIRAALAVAALLFVPASAAAQTFVSSEPMRPLHYSYAACVFASGRQGVEVQIQQCSNLRSLLAEEAIALFSQYRRDAGWEMDRDLLNGFVLIENEARFARSRRIQVPDQLMSYLGCLGDGLRASEAYRRGISIDYIALDRQCRASHRQVEGLDASARSTLRRLTDRFRVRDRFVNDPDSTWPDLRWRDGFIELP